VPRLQDFRRLSLFRFGLVSGSEVAPRSQRFGMAAANPSFAAEGDENLSDCSALRRWAGAEPDVSMTRLGKCAHKRLA
jgi:hypothetical protein